MTDYTSDDVHDASACVSLSRVVSFGALRSSLSDSEEF